MVFGHAVDYATYCHSAAGSPKISLNRHSNSWIQPKIPVTGNTLFHDRFVTLYKVDNFSPYPPFGLLVIQVIDDYYLAGSSLIQLYIFDIHFDPDLTVTFSLTLTPTPQV